MDTTGSTSGGNLTMQKVFEYFQSQVQSSVNSLNSELDSVGGSTPGGSTPSSSDAATGGGVGAGAGTNAAAGPNSASGGSSSGGISGDPVESGTVSYLFQMVSVAMSTESSTVKSMRDSLSGTISSIN